MHLPNADGTFNNRRLDLFLAGTSPASRAWLITAAGSLSGFVMTMRAAGGGQMISDFFVVRAMRRTGVGAGSGAPGHRHVPRAMGDRVPVLQSWRPALLVDRGSRRVRGQLGDP
jgi:hypothetical protein